MFNYNEFGISLSFHFVYLLLAVFLIIGYTYFTYRYTLPPTGKLNKLILISLRTLALSLLIVILFEPVLNLVKKENITALNFVFVDNSRSMKIKDQTDREETTLNILEDLSLRKNEDKLILCEFGSDVNDVPEDSLNKIKFSEGLTNIASIYNYIEKSKIKPASIILISDGVFNTGTNPYYAAIKAGIPVFSIGIGDTTRRKDVEIKKVLYNDILYANTPTSISVTIQNYGFAKNEITISFFEDDKIISTKRVTLAQNGIQNTGLVYTPETSGEKKITVTISGLDGEFTLANNKKIFYLNVLSNKINVLLISSSPSPDLSFIKNALQSDENLSVNTITQINSERFLENVNYSLLDSADILFLIGFPSKSASDEVWERIKDKILNEKTPYFLTLSAGSSLEKLLELNNELTFNVNQIMSGYRQVQPEISQKFSNHPVINYSSNNVLNDWNNLPPVLQPNSIFAAKPESKVLSHVKINNRFIESPLILLRNFSGRKSISILAKNIWKWKLQTVRKQNELFDSFILNSVKWLNAAEDKRRVKIRTSKKNYSQGERIEFSAQVLDESLNPVSNADVQIQISSDDDVFDTDLQVVGNGIYEGTISINKTGDFSYKGKAVRDGLELGEDNGTFNIGEIDLEMIDPVMNFNLLNLLAKETGGKYYSPENYAELFQKIKEINRQSKKEIISTTEINLWSSEILLIIAILLFAFEWFLRKRIGLL